MLRVPVPVPVVSVLSPEEVDRESGLREDWERRIAASTDLYRLYQSPLWWDHLRATQGDAALRLVVVRDAGSSAIRAVIPCESRIQRVSRRIGQRLFSVLRVPGVELLGGAPLVDPHPEILEAAVAGIWHAFPRAEVCRLKSLPTMGGLWQQITGSNRASRLFFAMCDGRPRRFYSIRLDGGIEQYLSRFTGKQRSDLRRKDRLLEEIAPGRVRLERVDTPDGVASVYRDLQVVAENDWLRRVKELPSIERLTDAARRGFLRSYVLYASTTPVAFVVGYQAHGVFHYSDVGFSHTYSRYSPGAVLLYRIIHDLCEHWPAEWLNFGIGDAEYKRRFSNVCTEDATVFLMRRTFRNRLRQAAVNGLDVVRRLRESRRSVRTPEVLARSTSS